MSLVEDERSTGPGEAVPSLARRAKPEIFKVTVVLTESSFASTSVGPIEIFHSAGTLWNQLHGDSEDPRFRVRIASVDGKPVGYRIEGRFEPGEPEPDAAVHEDAPVAGVDA